MTAAKKPAPITAAAPDFQAQLEPLLNRAAQQGREIIITQQGYPVARVMPYIAQPGDPPFPAAEKPAGAANPDANPEQLRRDLAGPTPPEWWRWLGREARWENAFIREEVVETRDRYGKAGARKRVTIKLLGDAVELGAVESTKGQILTPNPEEPPILEDVFEIKDAAGQVVERRVYHLQILGDIIAPIDEEWEAEVNPDRVLNPYLPRTAAPADPDPEREPLVLEDVFEIKDAAGNAVERKVFPFTIWGEPPPIIAAEGETEVNPDRRLNLC